MRHKITTGLVLTAALFAGTTTAAEASGRSAKTNGCYAQWGDTGTSGYCKPATVSGYYQVRVDCSYEPRDSQSSFIYIQKGSTITRWGQEDCTFGVNRAYIRFHR